MAEKESTKLHQNTKDISGKRFDRLLVLAYAGKSRWTCLCDCGKRKDIRSTNLLRGITRSCGCLSNDVARERQLQNLTGHRFERWTVLGEGVKAGTLIKWICQCDCGTIKEVFGAALRTGMSKSCGCLKKDFAGSHSITHGMTNSPEYGIWCGMKARCYSPSSDRYQNYGARGITVCDRWKHSFESFLADMGPRPEGAEINRIDNDGHYEPSNCEWTTRINNMRNRQDALKYTHNGITKPLKEWSEITGIRYETLIGRMKNRRPMFTPVGPSGRRRR